MPTAISQVKTTTILRLYFSGMPQTRIAGKCGVHQATVSRCMQKFGEEAFAKGIMAAAKESRIMDEVVDLRGLAVDLYKGKMSVEEAKSGFKMVVLFNSLGVPTEEYKVLAKMLKKLKDPYFPKAAMKLIKLEDTTGKEYTDILSQFEKLGEEIDERQETIAQLQEAQEKEHKSLEKLELSRKGKEVEKAAFLKEAGQQKTAAKAEVEAQLAEAGLTMEKIAKLHPVVQAMNGLGISDDKLETFFKERQALAEKGITWAKFQTVAGALAKAGDIDGDGIAAELTEYGTLDKTIISMKAEKSSLGPQVQELGKKKVKLTAETGDLSNSKAYLEVEVKHLKASKKALDDTNDTLSARRTHLEKHVAGLENEVTELGAENKALTMEADKKRHEIAEMDEKLNQMHKESESVGKWLKEKQAESQNLDAKIAAEGPEFRLFQAFEGAIAGGTEPKLQELLESIPAMVNQAKKGQYSTEFLAKYIIDQLTGNAFGVFSCENCGARLVMVKRGKKQLIGGGFAGSPPFGCPECGSTLGLDKSLLEILKKEPQLGKKATVPEPQIVTPVEKNTPPKKTVEIHQQIISITATDTPPKDASGDEKTGSPSGS